MIIILRKTYLSILALISLLTVPGLAADVSVILKLDRHKATSMDSVRMVVEVSGVRNIDGQPEIQGIGDFEVVQGGTSSRVEIINGKMSTSIEYNYTLQPVKTGDFLIGPALVWIKGDAVRSNTEKLQIIEPPKSAGESRGPLFLNASLSSKEAYVEEQIIYTLRLYRQADVSDIHLRLPEADNLMFRQMGKPVEYQGEYNGHPYQILEVRYFLTASKEGVYGIRPARMNLLLIQGRKKSPFGMFDDPFFSSVNGEPKTLASEPLELKVLPVPEENRPSDYCGLVGDFVFDSKLEPSEVRAGESSTLTVILRGRGNVKLMPDLRMPEIEHIKVYADQPVLNEEMGSEGFEGSKTMKWALVPEKEGEYTIPGLSVSFFDIEGKRFRNIKSSSFNLKVLPGEEASPIVSKDSVKDKEQNATNKKEVKELARDILPIHGTTKDFHSGRAFRSAGFLFWMLLLVPVFLYGTAVFYSKFSRISGERNRALKAKKAAGQLIRHSRGKGITQNEMIQALQTYINDRLGLAIGSLTAADVSEIMKERDVSTSTTEEWREMVKKFEDAIYTGKGDERCEMHQEIKKLVKKLEKEIR
ncbi:MAG: protein BatD [Deltaproteobacteria bacterium]|nr:protein BatD [Deltaproteobacteria bacterium]